MATPLLLMGGADLNNQEMKNSLLEDSGSLDTAKQLGFHVSRNEIAWYHSGSLKTIRDVPLQHFTPSASVSMNSQKLTDLAAATNPADAITLQQAQSLANTNRSWKELVLVPQQMDSVGNSINQAMLFDIDIQIGEDVTFTVTDGTASETYTAKSSPASAFEFNRGTDKFTSASGLVAAINTDSTLWSAVTATFQFSGGSGTSVVIYRKTQPSSTKNDRFFISASNSSFRYINYGSGTDYSNTTLLNPVPTSDPAVRYAGFGRLTADLIPNEAHAIKSDDASIYLWDDDGGTWQNVGSSGIMADEVSLHKASGVFSIKNNGVSAVKLNADVAGAGLQLNGSTNALEITATDTSITIGSNSIGVNASDGLTISSGLKVNLEAAGTGTGGLMFNSGAIRAKVGNGIRLTTSGIEVDQTIVPKISSFTTVGGSSTESFTHNHGTKDVFVQVRRLSDDQLVYPTPTATSTNAISLDFGVDPSTGYKVNVLSLVP